MLQLEMGLSEKTKAQFITRWQKKFMIVNKYDAKRDGEILCLKIWPILSWKNWTNICFWKIRKIGNKFGSFSLRTCAGFVDFVASSWSLICRSRWLAWEWEMEDEATETDSWKEISKPEFFPFLCPRPLDWPSPAGKLLQIYARGQNIRIWSPRIAPPSILIIINVRHPHNHHKTHHPHHHHNHHNHPNPHNDHNHHNHHNHHNPSTSWQLPPSTLTLRTTGLSLSGPLLQMIVIVIIIVLIII